MEALRRILIYILVALAVATVYNGIFFLFYRYLRW
jgi:hypothetical protein